MVSGQRESAARRVRRRSVDVEGLSRELALELTGLGEGRLASRLARQVAEAAVHYAADRYREALRLLQPAVRAVPEWTSAHELLGLTLYRLGQWKAALAELEAARRGGDDSQLPVIADCWRALGDLGKVEAVWREARRAGLDQSVLAEARIVMAGALADAGRLGAAIALLEEGLVAVRNPALHHLRRYYALADLYERAGDVPRARSLFEVVLRADPSLFDTAERLAELR